MKNKSSQQPGFFGPLSSPRQHAVITWALIVAVCTLKITIGDQSFFEKVFGTSFETGPALDWFKWLYHHLWSLLLFFIIPIIFQKTVLNQKPADTGLKIGDWRFGLKATAIAFLVLPLPVYWSSQNPEHLAWYPLTTLANESWHYFFLWGLTYIPHYLGWEYFFRGYIGMGMKQQLGAAGAIALQTLITTLLHIGKPMGETYGAVFAGVYLGLLTYRTGSIWYAFLFHFYIGMLNTYFCG